MAETQSLKAPKPLGLEPGSAAYGLKTLTPNSKYAKVNAGCWLHYLALPTLKGQDTDTLLKVVFSGCSEVLTVVGGWVPPLWCNSQPPARQSVPLPEGNRELRKLLGEARCYLVPALMEDRPLRQ